MSIKRVWMVLLCFLLLSMQSLTASDARQENGLVTGEPVVSYLVRDEQQAWTFDGTAGDKIHLSAQIYPPDPYSELNVIIELYDSAGNLLISDDNTAPGTDAMLIHYPLPATDTYTVVVRNLNTWVEGSYLLRYQRSDFPADCLTPMGEMETGEMPSVVNGWPIRYRVFLPPCHDPAKRYPYVLLMHGSNSDDTHWEILGVDDAVVRGVALQEIPPMVVVLPFGGNLANTNTFGPGASWESLVIDELLPYMETTYCLQNTREGRAIGGISRGGFWAFEIAFRHPELFATLGGHSPFFDLYHAPASNNPLDLALAPPPNPPLRIWMDRGKNDYAQLNIDLINQRMAQNGIEHTYQLYAEGEHANNYWQAHLDDYLRFYTENWNTDVDSLPDCTP